MGWKWILVAACAMIVAGSAGWWLARPATLAALATPPPVAKISRPSAAQLHDLRQRADAACRCARNLENMGERTACWADFERELTRYEYSEGGTMCMDESEDLVCFGPNSLEEPCVSRLRPYGACSDEEARILMARARARSKGGCG